MNLISKLKLKYLPAKKKADFIKEKKLVNIGDDCEIHSGVQFGSEPYLIKLGNKVRVGSGVKFDTHDGGLWVIRNLGWNKEADKLLPIIIGDNVFIGWDTIIMPGVTIGSNVIIGAGSIVTKNIPDGCVFAGSPAKKICSLEEYYTKNTDKIENTKHFSYEEKKIFFQKKFKNLGIET